MYRAALVFVGLLLLPAFPVFGQWSVELESGRVWSGYNDVRIPGTGGTRFSLSQELEADPGMFVRVRLGHRRASGHEFLLLLAPLTLKAAGSLDRDVFFYRETFPAATPLLATYKFNSYRLTWRRSLLERNGWQLALGATGKVRDAFIRVEGGGLESTRTDLGFVPLVSFRLGWQPLSRFSLLLDGDALAAPQGRAEDLFIGGTFQLTPGARALLGYRFVEGGADVDRVYTFAMIHYLSAGLSLTF